MQAGTPLAGKRDLKTPHMPMHMHKSHMKMPSDLTSLLWHANVLKGFRPTSGILQILFSVSVYTASAYCVAGTGFYGLP